MVALVRLLAAFVLVCLALDARAQATSWELHLPGYSYHFGSPQQAGRHWADYHDGLGVQYTKRYEDAVIRYTGGFLRDSFNNQGLYAGAAFGWRLLRGDVDVELSAAPMLLYRTTRFDDPSGKAPMRLIPAVMPILSIEHRASGVGANVTVLPGGHFGKDLDFPGLIFVQFTYRLR